MRFATTVLALAGLGTGSIAHAQNSQARYKAAGDAAPAPVATVAYGPDPLQVADLRLPPRAAASGKRPFPVAIIIHGGCWRASVDKRTSIAALADALGRRGFATWNIEYRRVGDAGGGWPGTFRDIAAATDKLAAVASKYRLDVKKVTIVGHSAGAHLALWDASRPRLPAPWSRVAIRPVSVVGIDAQACGGPAIVPLMGGTPAQKPAEYRIASPADHLPLGVRQLLVGADFAPLMRPYAAAARRAGDPVEVIEPRDADHFDIVTPGTANGDAVVDFIAARALSPRGR